MLRPGTRLRQGLPTQFSLNAVSERDELGVCHGPLATSCFNPTAFGSTLVSRADICFRHVLR